MPFLKKKPAAEYISAPVELILWSLETTPENWSFSLTAAVHKGSGGNYRIDWRNDHTGIHYETTPPVSLNSLEARELQQSVSIAVYKMAKTNVDRGLYEA